MLCKSEEESYIQQMSYEDVTMTNGQEGTYIRIHILTYTCVTQRLLINVRQNWDMRIKSISLMKACHISDDLCCEIPN